MKSFSELTSASYVSNSDILAISQENSGTYSSKKTTVKEVSDFANQNFAEEYDSTSSYAVGDYCIYESVLYKCTASTTGSFDNTKWMSVVVTNEMGSGGGGTGGHTIIDENGNSMTARAGLQFVGANVTDDATNNKTIVDISGGGSGVYIEKTLWEDANGLQFAPNNIQTITLSESLNKYDFIYVDISSVADSGYHNQNILAVSSLYDENDGYNGVVCIGGNINLATSFAKVDNTHLKFIGFSSANPLFAWKVVGIKVSGDYYAPVIYSLEEREIGVWTDGKPLYEKTIIDTLPSSATSKDIALNISNIDKIVSLKGIAIRSDGGTTQIEHARADDTIWSMINGAKTVLAINIKDSSYTNQPVHFTVQYTKTTDTAGSGSWTPQGVPTHHYSLDEQVIGTYLGKTLYEKTILVNNGGNLNTGDNVITHNISNFGKLIDAKGNAIRNTGSSGERDMVIPYASGDTNSAWDIGIYEFDSTNGYIRVGNAYTGNYILHDCYVTIQYTKSS